MELRDAITARVSVRQFTKDPVGREDVRELVRLAGLAPSPNNQQPWRFIAITRASLLGQMADAVRLRLSKLLGPLEDDAARRAAQRVLRSSTFFADAPLAIAVIRRPYESVIEPALPESGPAAAQVNALRGFPDVLSVGAAVEHLLLAATDLGYGSCWLSGPLVARKELEALLEIRAPEVLASLVAVGRPAMAGAATHERRPVDEILTFVD